MKVLNSKKKSENFSGSADVCGTQIHINTENGEGYEEVIKRVMPFVAGVAKKYNFVGNSTEDTVQDIIVDILEGIPKFNPNKGAKLFTFLFMRVNRLLANRLKSQTKGSRSASLLNITAFNLNCPECKYGFFTHCDKGQRDFRCPACEKDFKVEKKPYPVAISEISENDLLNGGVKMKFIPEFLPSVKTGDDIIRREGLKRWLSAQDEKTYKILEMVCFKGYTVKEVSSIMNITPSSIYSRIKDAKDKDILLELLKNE